MKRLRSSHSLGGSSSKDIRLTAQIQISTHAWDTNRQGCGYLREAAVRRHEVENNSNIRASIVISIFVKCIFQSAG